MYFDNTLYSKVQFTVRLFTALSVINLTNLYVIINVQVFYCLAFIYCKVITINKFSI